MFNNEFYSKNNKSTHNNMGFDTNNCDEKFNENIGQQIK